MNRKEPPKIAPVAANNRPRFIIWKRNIGWGVQYLDFESLYVIFMKIWTVSYSNHYAKLCAYSWILYSQCSTNDLVWGVLEHYKIYIKFRTYEIIIVKSSKTYYCKNASDRGNIIHSFINSSVLFWKILIHYGSSTVLKVKNLLLGGRLMWRSKLQFNPSIHPFSHPIILTGVTGVLQLISTDFGQ